MKQRINDPETPKHSNTDSSLVMQLIREPRCRCNESSNRCIWYHALNELMHDFVTCSMKQCYMNHWLNVTTDQYREGSKLMSHWNSRSWITGHLNPKRWTKQAADKNQWYYRQIIPGTHEPMCQMQRWYEPMSLWAKNTPSAHNATMCQGHISSISPKR